MFARSGQPNARQPNNSASERKSERLPPPELSYEKSSRLGLIESKNFPGRTTDTLNKRRATEGRLTNATIVENSDPPTLETHPHKKTF